MKKLVHYIFLIFKYLAVLGLLSCYLSGYISPAKFSFFAFVALAYPFFLLANVFFLFWWIIRRKKLFLIPLVVIVVGWKHHRTSFQLHYNKKVSTSQIPKSIKILTYNVRLFNLYQWNKDKNIRNKIIHFVSTESPHIICFQEFYSRKKTKGMSVIDTLLMSQKAINQHVTYPRNSPLYRYAGVATFSVYPIVNRGEIRFENANSICIYTDLKIKKDTVRVYNSHLASNHFGKENYNFLDSIHYFENEHYIHSIGGIMQKLKIGYLKRASEADIIAAHIQNSPYPVIVCGDMNDTQISYTYTTIRGKLSDAFEQAGCGIGITYVSNFPVRIDHILYSPKYHCLEYRIPSVKYSDHYPVICYLGKQ